MKKRLLTAILTVGIVAGLAIGAQAAETIKIGFLTPLSGDSATYGKQCKAGAEMIAHLINTANPDCSMALAAEAGLPNLDGA